MIPTVPSMLAAVTADPDDDTVRLAYADALDERGLPGDPARAEFIRLQIRLARLAAADPVIPAGAPAGALTTAPGWAARTHPDAPPGRLDLHAREGELLRDHGAAWRLPLASVLPWACEPSVRFRRGFVAHLAAPLGPVLNVAHWLWWSYPVESLDLSALTRDALAGLAECSPLTHLRGLAIARHPTPSAAEAVRALVLCPHLANLRRLDLGFLPLTDADAVVVARSPLRPTELRVGGDLTAEGWERILYSPLASRLRQFRPFGPSTRVAGPLQHAPLRDLRVFEVTSPEWGAAGVRALVHSAHLRNLESLGLRNAGLTDAEAEELAAWPGLATVRALALDFNTITGRGLTALTGSPHFRPRYLSLCADPVGDAGAKALAGWPGLADVACLVLLSAGITDAGLAALAESPHWRDVRYVMLSNNASTAAGRAALNRRLGTDRTDVNNW